MDVLVTCKYEEDPIKNEGARVDTTFSSNFSDAQGQITLVLVSVSCRNLNSSKLSCMSSLPARMRMIDSKMKELECSQDFYGDFSRPIWPNFELVRDVMDVLVTCKYEDDPIKMKALEWTQHFPHYNYIAIRCHGNQSSDPTWNKT